MKRKSIIIFIIVLVFLYFIPIVFICLLSSMEVEKYSQDVDFNFKEMSYGEVVPVIRQDMREYYSFDGVFVSDLKKTVEIPFDAVVNVEVDEEVFCDSIIATLNNKEIKAEVDGIVSDIDYIKNKCIINDISSLLFECRVPKNYLKYFECCVLYDELNSEIKVINKSNIIDKGYTKVYLKVPSNEYCYGEEIQGFPIYTGNVFRDALVLPVDCVYKKSDDSRYYVREVSETGEFLYETEVTVGYSDGEYICISGIEEGAHCDSGYKAIVDSGEENE